MPRFERLPREKLEEIFSEESRKEALRRYLELVKLRAQQIGGSVLEIIGSDLADATNGRIGLRHREKPPEPKTEPEAVLPKYSFSTPYGSDLIYDPQRRIAVSPLLPEGTLVQLSPLQGLFLETFMQNPTAAYTQAALTSLLNKTLSQAPVPNESNRASVLIGRLRRKLGEPVIREGMPVPLFSA